MPTLRALGIYSFLPCQVKLFSGHGKKLSSKYTHKFRYHNICMKGSGRGEEVSSIARLQQQSRRVFLISVAQFALLGLLRPKEAVAAEESFAKIWTKRVFPKAGYNTPESLTSETVQIDAEAMKDPQVKKGLENLRAYRKKVLDMCSAFQKDPQLEIQQLVRDNFNVAQLRDDLNKANRVFNEETQITTDRFVRNILQDVDELESVSGLLEDKTRTPRKIENTQKWLKKLYHDFDRFLALYPES